MSLERMLATAPLLFPNFLNPTSRPISIPGIRDPDQQDPSTAGERTTTSGAAQLLGRRVRASLPVHGPRNRTRLPLRRRGLGPRAFRDDDFGNFRRRGLPVGILGSEFGDASEKCHQGLSPQQANLHGMFLRIVGLRELFRFTLGLYLDSAASFCFL